MEYVQKLVIALLMAAVGLYYGVTVKPGPRSPNDLGWQFRSYAKTIGWIGGIGGLLLLLRVLNELYELR